MGINDLEKLKTNIEKEISDYAKDFFKKYGHKMKEWPDLAGIALIITQTINLVLMLVRSNLANRSGMS